MFLERLLWPLFMSFKALNQYVDILFKNLRAYYSRQKNIFLVKMKLIKKRRSNFVLHSENTLREINLQKKILFYAVLISICNYLHCKCDIVTKMTAIYRKISTNDLRKTWQKKFEISLLLNIPHPIEFGSKSFHHFH